MLATFLTMREHYHFDIISERLTITSPDVHAGLERAAGWLIARGTPPGLAPHQAMGELRGHDAKPSLHHDLSRLLLRHGLWC